MHRFHTLTRTSTRRWRAGLAAVVVVPLLGLAACAPGPTSRLLRPVDPVVITGASVAALVGSAPGDIVAFRYDPTDPGEQIPVQVDERKLVNFGTAYGGAANSVNIPGYADPNTYAGADPDPLLDADDEIAFMARDAGGRPPAHSVPAGVVGRYRSGGADHRPAEPVPDRHRVPVPAQRLRSIRPPARTTSVTSSTSCRATTRRPTGSPTVRTPRTRPSRRPTTSSTSPTGGPTDSIKITAPGASGVDILDRHKNLFAPGNCGRSEDTFDDAEGAFIVNKDGPVRAIRSYIGANSGPNTQREHIFYEQREDIRTFLRVHAIPRDHGLLRLQPGRVRA